MATRHLSRALQSATKPMSSIISHSYTTAAIPRSSLSRLRPVVAAATATYVRRLAPSVFTRAFATRQTSSSLNDPSPNWSNRPPKETILLDGCDFEHWLVVMEKPEPDATRDEIIDSYIKTLAMVVGSEEEARMKIYSVSTRHYFAFGALVPEELSLKMKELPKVTWVLPDSYLDVRNKDYGGEPFINGQAVPYDAKYHEEWLRNNARANERNRRNDRPRNNNDRSRNFERRNMNSGGGGGNFNGGGGGNFSGGGGGGGGGNFNSGPPAGNQQMDAKYQQNYPGQSPPQNAPNAGGMQQNFANNNPGNFPPRGPPPPPANNNGPNYQYGASNGPAPYHSGPGSNQAGYAPGTGQGPNQNNVSQAYVPPSAVGGNQYQNQNRGYVADGQNQSGYSAPQNAGYGQGQNQNTYGQMQNGYVPQNGGHVPQNGGQGQNQGGGYVNPNVAGRDPNY